ncbi:MAG: hypothetical protein HQK87_03240, partial [Nitrospinae bacterium]|nr:hypothetical protein [Nitrospinota bacterium]
MELTLRHRPLAPVDPASLFRVAAGEPGLVWLDSSLPGGAYGRWSYLMRRPVITLDGAGGRWRLRHGAGEEAVDGDPFERIERMTRRGVTWADPSADLPPFTGGAVGFLGYGLAPWGEPSLNLTAPPAPEGDLRIGWYDGFIAFDHQTGRSIAVGSADADLHALAHSADEARRLP